MDKAASAEKAVLGRKRQCSEDSNVNCRQHLCASGYFGVKTENIALCERNVIDNQLDYFRQDTCKPAF
jgi:hypothetical protein